MSEAPPVDVAPVYDRWRHLYSCGLVGATLFLVFAGGLVTSTGSGLAVPDWPLSYGMWFPPMVGGVFYEHGHRMIAGTVGILTVVLAAWTWVTEERPGVRRLALAALGAVVLQAALGGLTVIFLLPTPISVAHACLGQIFFCLVVALALVTGRDWTLRGSTPRREPDVDGLRTRTAALVAVVFVQLFLGAWMRHSGAGLAIPDFPLAFGRVIPQITSPAIALHFAHRAGAIAVLAVALTACGRVLRRSHDPALKRPASVVLAFVVLQIGLGAATIWTGKAVLPTTAHVATGAAILGTALALALRVHQRRAAGAVAGPRAIAAGARA